MNRLILIAVALLSGCVKDSSQISVKCNTEQLKMVDDQFNTCSKSSYLDSFCYDQARLEQCDIIRN